MSLITFSGFVIVIGFLCYINDKCCRYFEIRGFPYRPALSLFNLLWNLFFDKTSSETKIAKLYSKCKHYQYYGFFSGRQPNLLITDPELVKKILVTDFQFFTDRSQGAYNEKLEPLTVNIFNLEGEKWKALRTKLSPTFTSGRLKDMYNLVLNCENNLKKYVENRIPAPVEVGEAAGRLTTDVIVNCAFGLDCESLINENEQFREIGRRIFPPTLWTYFIVVLRFTYPKLFRMLGLRSVPKDTTDFLSAAIKQAIAYRKNATTQRKDFVNILMELENQQKIQLSTINGTENSKHLEINENFIAAQAFLFFVAGFETSAGTLTFCLYELAKNAKVQNKLREEIIRKIKDRLPTYEELKDIEYLDMILNETLRKYPVLKNLTRVCTKNYTIPNTSLIIEKGMRIVIPITSIEKDPDYFPYPEDFVPERFSKENRSKIRPGTHLPFGDGPRICLGMQFAMMEFKSAITVLVKNYRITLDDKTRQPLEMASSVFRHAVGGIWLNFEPI